MKTKKLLMMLFASSTLLLTACGGGSSSSGNDTTDNSSDSATPGDNSNDNSLDNGSSDDSGNSDNGDNQDEDSTGSTVTDTQITDQSWVSGVDKMVDMVWPYGDFKTGAPLYMLKHTSNSSKIMKGKAATSSENAENFTEIRSFSGTNMSAIEVYPFSDDNNTRDRLIILCNNQFSPASIRIYKESDLLATPATFPLYQYYQTGSGTEVKRISNCDSLSIAQAGITASGFSVTLFVGGTGTDSRESTNQYHIAKTMFTYDTSATGEFHTAFSGGNSVVIYQLSTLNYHVKAMHAVDNNSAVIAYTAPVTGENRVRLVRQGAAFTDLMISTQNKFDGTTSLWQVADIHVWKKSDNDIRMYMTSPGGGTFAISYDATTATKNGDYTFTSGDAQHCSDVITGFRNRAPSATLWCQDSTDKAELLEFTAPDLPIL